LPPPHTQNSGHSRLSSVKPASPASDDAPKVSFNGPTLARIHDTWERQVQAFHDTWSRILNTGGPSALPPDIGHANATILLSVLSSKVLKELQDRLRSQLTNEVKQCPWFPVVTDIGSAQAGELLPLLAVVEQARTASAGLATRTSSSPVSSQIPDVQNGQAHAIRADDVDPTDLHLQQPPKKKTTRAVLVTLVTAVALGGLLIGLSPWPKKYPGAPTSAQPAVPEHPAVRTEPQAQRVPRQQVVTNPSGAVLAMIVASKNGDTTALFSAKQKIDLFPKPTRGDRKLARDKNRLGLDAVKRDDYENAIARFNEGVTADPSDVELKNNLGYALMMAGRLDDARRALFESVVLDPGRAAAWANLGQTLAQQGDEDSAVAAFVNTFIFSRAQNKTIDYLTNLSQSNPSPRVKSAAAKALNLPVMKLSDAASTTSSQEIKQTRAPNWPACVPASVVDEYKRLPNEKAFAVVLGDRGGCSWGFSYSGGSQAAANETALRRCAEEQGRSGMPGTCTLL